MPESMPQDEQTERGHAGSPKAEQISWHIWAEVKEGGGADWVT